MLGAYEQITAGESGNKACKLTFLLCKKNSCSRYIPFKTLTISSHILVLKSIIELSTWKNSCREVVAPYQRIARISFYGMSGP